MKNWWNFKQPEPAVQMKAVELVRPEVQSYRDYQLEIKSLSVGWQVIVTKNGSYVNNGSIKSNMKNAIDEAHTLIDGLSKE